MQDENAKEEKKDVKILGISIPYAIADFLQSIVFALVICIFIYIVIAMPNQIEGDSMKPNFHNGEIILTNKITQWLGGTPFGQSINLDYNRGDVIVFQKPGYNDFIKRIIGLPGDQVNIKNGSVYINGKKLIEDYLPSTTTTKGGDFIETDGKTMTIPEGRYFVLGDNRSDSHDSRYLDIGFIDRSWMKGKVILRYWPIQDFEVVHVDAYKFE